MRYEGTHFMRSLTVFDPFLRSVWHKKAENCLKGIPWCEEIAVKCKDDLIKYTTYTPACQEDNLISYWKSASGFLPALAPQALRCLSVPCTLCQIESENAKIQKILETEGSGMSPTSLANWVKCNFNAHLVESDMNWYNNNVKKENILDFMTNSKIKTQDSDSENQDDINCTNNNNNDISKQENNGNGNEITNENYYNPNARLKKWFYGSKKRTGTVSSDESLIGDEDL